MNLFKTEQQEGKTVPITQKQVLLAWKKVKAGKGSGGVDGKSLQDVEQNLRNELYKLWSRMASGSYFPKPVKAVNIPKWDGSHRQLGIPTITDRVAQQVVKDLLESELEKVFHPDSYGYRPNKNAHLAIEKCRERCFKYDWVIDLDIKGFFDTIDHQLLIKALQRHTDQKWIVVYVKRWLEAPLKTEGREETERYRGTPQGGVISPLLANLFLHYVFDKWMEREWRNIRFERYADDIIIHCSNHYQTQKVLHSISQRFKECKLQLHPDKTKVAYCKDSRRKKDYPVVTFDFLGFGFKPRKVRNPKGGWMTSFCPAIGSKAKKHISETFKKLKVHRATNNEIENIAYQLAPKLRGWINYFSKFRKWEMYTTFKRLNARLVKWIMNKYKSYRNKTNKARKKLITIASEYPNLFVHWKYGFYPR